MFLALRFLVCVLLAVLLKVNDIIRMAGQNNYFGLSVGPRRVQLIYGCTLLPFTAPLLQSRVKSETLASSLRHTPWCRTTRGDSQAPYENHRSESFLAVTREISYCMQIELFLLLRLVFFLYCFLSLIQRRPFLPADSLS